MRRLLTPGWLACHTLMVVLVVAMLGLAGWQLTRANAGNALSWGYTFQWPVFAGFVVFIWWREVQRVRQETRAAEPAGPAVGVRRSGEQPGSGSAETRRRPVITRRTAATAYDDGDDPALAAYNRYLAWLATHPDTRPGAIRSADPHPPR